MSQMIANIKELMHSKGWNGQDLAEKSGQKASDIYNILSGKSKKPSADKIEGIARAFNVSTAKILYGTQSQPEFVQPNENWDGLLYNEAMTLVRDICKKRGVKFTDREEEKSKLMRLATRVYNYAKKRSETNADHIFAEDIIAEETD